MKANPQDQKSLLDLVQLDLELAKNASDSSKLLASKDVETANANALSMSDRLIDSRNAVGELELELKRSENDLELVEKRIAKDQQRLATTSSPKDAQGIEHELAGLIKRKGELEEVELLVMERLESSKLELQLVSDQKLAAEQSLTQAREHLSESLKALEQDRSGLITRRTALISTLNPELALVYQNKASRSVAVGRLVGRECGACRLSITATNFEEIVSLPSDEIAECPNCQALLVRA